jgi:trehalose 6-phosphate synthase/phosphatase
MIHNFTYRYAVHRAGVFHRWEDPSDGPTAEELHPPVQVQGHTVKVVVEEKTVTPPPPPPPFGHGGSQADLGLMDAETPTQDRHEVPLHLLADRETYIVNDVLGLTTIPPDIDHIRLPSGPMYTKAASLHSQHSSAKELAQGGPVAGASPSPAVTARKKHVNFAPMPQATYSQRNEAMTKQTVHLNSTDGLVVVSVFLPIILHRSTAGEWSADWDYEMLLSMQTHLRVTRIGVVKWRGWHGNTNTSGDDDGSPEAGVPRS